MRAVLFVGVHGADDVGVLQPADGLHFPLEARHRVRVSGPFLGEDLDGDDLVQAGVQGLVHRAHAPLAELGQQLVLAELAQIGRFGRRRHRRPATGGGVAADRLHQGHGLAAACLGGVRVFGRGLAQRGHERVRLAAARQKGLLTHGAGAQVLRNRVRPVIRQLAQGVIGQLTAGRATRRCHRGLLRGTAEASNRRKRR